MPETIAAQLIRNMGDTFYAVVGEALKVSSSDGTTYVYRGIDRSPWQCVDDIYFSGTMPEDLVLLRDASRRTYVGNLSFGTTQSLLTARRLASVCKTAGKIAIVEAMPLGILDALDSNRTSAQEHLGFDAYIDGYGSPLRLGSIERPDLFALFSLRLTGGGLFQTIADISEYLAIYARVFETGDLEPLNDTGDVWVYEIVADIAV